MNFKFIRNRIVIAMLTSAILAPAGNILAAEGMSMIEISAQEKTTEVNANSLVNAVAEIKKEDHTEKIVKIVTAEEVQFQTKISNKVFVAVEEDYALVVETTTEDSAWVGKVFVDSEVKLLERGNEWSKIESGNVLGYVKTEKLITGNDAIAHAESYLKVAYPEKDILTLTQEEIDAVFSIGETKAEEEARLAAEAAEREAALKAAEEARIAAEKEAKRQKGLEVVAYAKQFLGNPYVYGGTSLTRGTDCSGFVMSVYAHFGISLEHSSYSMRGAGYKVSVSEIQPGDIVCFPGHVGIYAGDGKVINAINEKKGIGMSNLHARKIITVRRIF